MHFKTQGEYKLLDIDSEPTLLKFSDNPIRDKYFFQDLSKGKTFVISEQEFNQIKNSPTHESLISSIFQDK